MKTQSMILKKTLLLLLLACGVLQQAFASADPYDHARVKPVKNVILMIADGTSLATISTARWYQRTLDAQKQKLHLDPYMCGTVLTYCSNAPIGDSAPTTSAYMTGVPSIDGFVSTYPFSSREHDLVPLDSLRAYAPITTLMEATRLLHNRRLGLVFTCELPHATPADCVAHSYDRRRYDWIVPQMIALDIDVVIGGGASLITPARRAQLEGQGTMVLLNDIEAMRSHKQGKMWSLYADMDMPYDFDRDATMPSLAEMTSTALQHLDGSEEGFMLMVEGSKIDWAAHANDPVGMVSDMLAFDKACQVALDFAQRDGNTVVIITSDHGNSGISIGHKGLKKYAQVTQSQLFGQLAQMRRTADGLARMLQETPYDQAAKLFKEYANIAISSDELVRLAEVPGYKQSPKNVEAKATQGELPLYSAALTAFVAEIYRKHLPFGFTTNGHTGEEVFLSIYAPESTERLVGHRTNIDLHNYMRALLGVQPSMIELADEHYVPHTKLFEGMKYEIRGDKPEEKQLLVRKGRKKLVLSAFSCEVQLSKKKTIKTPLPAVYVDKNDLFYVDKSLLDHLK